jgi:2-oxoglutarate ferredoxin oxidoreductase subunit alpha
LVPEQFLDRLEAAGRVIAVEGNAGAQLAGLIYQTAGFNIESTILRYDGLPITPDYILSRL